MRSWHWTVGEQWCHRKGGTTEAGTSSTRGQSITGDKVNHFKIGLTLSAADDENVANQRVTDFVGARAEELTFETLGSTVDNDDSNTVVRVSQHQWELRLAGVGCLDGVRVITRDGDETLGDVYRHATGTDCGN